MTLLEESLNNSTPTLIRIGVLSDSSIKNLRNYAKRWRGKIVEFRLTPDDPDSRVYGECLSARLHDVFTPQGIPTLALKLRGRTGKEMEIHSTIHYAYVVANSWADLHAIKEHYPTGPLPVLL